jgi:hypothetical protein
MYEAIVSNVLKWVDMTMYPAKVVVRNTIRFHAKTV